MNHEDQFKYQSIDLATDAIRLLRLLRGSHQDPIQCELFESFLHQVDGVPYEALSYTWGTSHDVRKITLNDRKALIKESLHTALLALRQPDHDRLLWIDAICIDQNDFKEKGHQVGQMRQIYENAEQVVVWLGPSNRDTDAFMDMARRWDHETRQQPGARNAQRWVDSWIRLTADEIGPVGIEIAARRRDALQEILNRPWFRRVWILQEVASAKKATIQCGSKSMSSQGFGLLPFLLGLRVDSHTQAVLDILPSYRRRDTWWGEKQDLQTLLVKFRTSKATDDRDRIYALLGISSDACTSSTLLPNYGKSIGDVVRNTIQFLLFKNARCLFAHRLPYDLTLNTFLYLVPNLPDFIYAWSLRSGNDDIAAAVLPQVVNLNIPEHL
ncbi:heterokaryon incompatibility protein-domain-containing protein, partial [Sordaria brevicollis]